MARILDRLQRLENVVLNNNERGPPSIAASNSEKTAQDRHEDVTQNEIFHSVGRSDPSVLARAETEIDARNIELTAQGYRMTTKTEDTASFLFVVAPVTDLILDLELNVPVLTKISINGIEIIRRICLPDRKEAQVLFKSYSRSLGSWYHIYHRHTVEALLNQNYDLLACGQTPKLEHAALLLSIFASGAYFQAFAAWPESVFSTSEEANQLSLHWKQNTIDILAYIERSSIPSSVEQLQATIILSLLMQNLEGLSKKYWLLHGTAITLARDLSLHVLDHPNRKGERNSVVEKEVKRRLWWYLAGTDWYFHLPSFV